MTCQLSHNTNSDVVTWSKIKLDKFNVIEIIENHLKSLNIIWILWKSLKIIWIHWKLLKIIKNIIKHGLYELFHKFWGKVWKWWWWKWQTFISTRRRFSCLKFTKFPLIFITAICLEWIGSGTFSQKKDIYRAKNWQKLP